MAAGRMRRGMMPVHHQPQRPALELRVPTVVTPAEPGQEGPTTVVSEGDELGPALVVGPFLAQATERGPALDLRLEASDQIGGATTGAVMESGEEEQPGWTRRSGRFDLQLIRESSERNLHGPQRRRIPAPCGEAQDSPSLEVFDAHLHRRACDHDVVSSSHATIVVSVSP